MPYIPCKQMQQLREAARNGDERAKRILRAQLEDTDYSADLEEYFAPKQEEIVTEKQPETEIVQENQENQGENQAQEAAQDISQAILSLISLCDKKTLEIANDSNISEATKKGALSILGEIKQSELENLEKFGKLMSSIEKKEEKKQELEPEGEIEANI